MSEVRAAQGLSAFKTDGFSTILARLKQEVQELYLSDSVPWVIGYSGGKDSTAVLQLVWLALSELDAERRTKPVHVISTDTLVENPIVSRWVQRSHASMKRTAEAESMPVQTHCLMPEIQDTFWVNLIGRGYPAPRNKFRWCTERLKIKPSNTFIRNMIHRNGEAILLLGIRKGESATRARHMSKHEKKAVRDRLAPNASMANCLIYTPIEDWSNDDVWAFLMRIPNPWGFDNKQLLGMYQGASEDGECPLVVDTGTPSCGSSRFGCWVCTLVDQDKSMSAMVQNDSEKEWMLPLLALRDELDFRGDEARIRERKRRDFRRLSGNVTYHVNVAGEAQLVHGPYRQDARAHWLRRVLQTQRWINVNGPDEVRHEALITPSELHEIRRIWVIDKHEIEDLLPQIYEEELEKAYPGPPMDDNLLFDGQILSLLKEVADNNELHFELVRNLLDVERQYRTMASRRGLFEGLERMIKQCFYENEQDALTRARLYHESRHGMHESLREESESHEGSARAHGKREMQGENRAENLGLGFPSTPS